MRRLLLRSAAFVRAARRLAKKNPETGAILHATFDLRIVFEFVQHGGSEAILLQTVGTHDEVY